MKAIVVALIAAGLVVPAFARMEVDQPKAEKRQKKVEKGGDQKREAPKKK